MHSVVKNSRTEFLAKPVPPLCKGHVVQFYADDNFLAEAVAHYSASGLTKGEGVILILTRAHWDLIDKQLKKKGINVEDARKCQQLLVLDAYETLAKFMINELPDKKRFTETIGGVLRQVQSKYPCVRAYGEMVDILWSQGNRTGMLALENRWNELAKTRSFELLCGYVIKGFDRESHRQVFKDICDTHSHVLPTEEFAALKDNDSRNRTIAILQQQALALKQEIKERGKIEDALRESQKQLQEALRYRDEFLSIASHELKTPITSLKIHLQLAQRSIKLGQAKELSVDKLSNIFNVSTRQVQRLTSLIDDLLDVSRIQTGKLTFQFEPNDLAEIVCDVIEHFGESFSMAGISPDLQLTAGSQANIDRFRIEQVVVNLLSNAIKYAPGKPLRISVSPEGSSVKFVVEDGGPGIAESEQQKIFEQFGRASSTANISGLGLGLFIVRQIVEAHKGTVTVESALEKGSKFTVLLPLC